MIQRYFLFKLRAFWRHIWTHMVHAATSRISCIIPNHSWCDVVQLQLTIILLWFLRFSGATLICGYTFSKKARSVSRESESLWWAMRAKMGRQSRLGAALPSYRLLPSLPLPSDEMRDFANNAKAVDKFCKTTWSKTLRIQKKCGLDAILLCFPICIWVKQKCENSWDACAHFAQEIRSLLDESGEHIQ